MKKIVFYFILLVAFFFIVNIFYIKNSVPLLEAGSNEEVNSYYPVNITTFNVKGEKVEQTIPKKPKRVVIYGINNFETLLYLGQGESIAATTINKTSQAWKEIEKKYPEEIKKVSSVEKFEPNAETVVAVNPDIIIGWKSTFSSLLKRPTEWWNERGINSYIIPTSNHIIPKGTIEDECQYIADMGKIFNAQEKAKAVIADIYREIKQTEALVQSREKQSVIVIEFSGKGFMNYDSGWMVGDMVQRLGGQMPVKEKRIGYEDLIATNPDVIFFVYFDEFQHKKINELFSKAEFSSLKAVKGKRIYPIAFEYMYTPAIKTIEGLKLIKHGLYPDLI